MKSEKEIVERTQEMESLYDPTNDYSYLDEGQQTELSTLLWVLDRELSNKEKKKIERMRKDNE